MLKIRSYAGIVCVLGLLIALSGQGQTTIPIYAAEDTFVLLPGPGNMASYWDGADRNFGYMRSRHVAAATAHPGNDISVPAKGEFDSVLRFYPSNAVEQCDAQYGVGRWRISGLAFKLMTSDNVAGPGLFNAPGNAGQYHVCWMPGDGGWGQGSGYINQDSGSHDPSAHPDNFSNLTFNSLEAVLATSPPVILNTLDFVKQGILVPVTNALTVTNLAFLNALAEGAPTSLLLSAADDHVAFNFTSHLYGDDRASDLYSAAIYLTASPMSAPTADLESMGGARYLTLHFQRLSNATNLTYTVEAGTNLNQNAWSFLAGSAHGAAMTGAGMASETDAAVPGVRNVTVRDLVPVTGAEARFLKLRITK